MKEWEYTFDPVSKEEWIRQIESDLRQKPLSSLHSEWWPGEPLIPILHEEDLTGEVVRLPDHFFNQPPLIIEFINTSGTPADVVNQKLLEALQYGAQSIILQTNLSSGFLNDHWFDGVMKEMVTLSVQPDPVSQETLNVLSNTSLGNVLIRLIRKENSPPFNHLLDTLSLKKFDLDSLRFVYHFPSSGIWDVQTANTLNILLGDLYMWTTAGMSTAGFLNQCVLVTDADPAYFKHIIQSKVLHLLWQNLKNHKGAEQSGNEGNNLECHIYQTENQDSDQFLIRASMSALAASLSGTSALCIHQDDLPGSPAFYRRVNRDIHHLLSLESGMYKGKDPLAGAYAIDFHSKSWTKKIWDRLSLEK